MPASVMSVGGREEDEVGAKWLERSGDLSGAAAGDVTALAIAAAVTPHRRGHELSGSRAGKASPLPPVSGQQTMLHRALYDNECDRA